MSLLCDSKPEHSEEQRSQILRNHQIPIEDLYIKFRFRWKCCDSSCRGDVVATIIVKGAMSEREI